MKLLKALCLFFILTGASCNKDKEPVSQLPPETQEGKGTFGCLINGQAFIPKGNGSLGPVKTCYYQHIYPSSTGFVFHVGAIDKSNYPLKSISINIDSIKLQEGMTIELGGNSSRAGAQCINGIVSSEYTYYTIKGFVGSINIKKFDEINLIAVGTFWFKAVNSFGDTVNVSEGRFDMKYTR